MRHLKALAIVVSGVLAKTDSGTNLACSSFSTIYMTISDSSATETIYVTSYVTLEPLQVTSVVTDLKSLHSKKGLTSSSSYQATELLVDIPLGTAATTSTFGNAYTGLGIAGWNATTFPPVKTESSGVSKSEDPSYVYKMHVSFSGTAYPTNKIYPIDQATREYPRRFRGRAVGDVTVATIHNATVSGPGDYDGTSITEATIDLVPGFTAASIPPTSPVSNPAAMTEFPVNIRSSHQPIPTGSTVATSGSVSAFVVTSETSFASPSTTIAIYPWDLSKPANSAELITVTSTVVPPTSAGLVSTTSSTSGLTTSRPYTSVAIYPWDLSPEPSTYAVSTTLATLRKIARHLNSSSILNVAAAQPSPCSGESASVFFTIAFDDLTQFDASDTEHTDVPPIFNPYRNLYWYDHFSYVSPPSATFLPKSPPRLAIYRTNKQSDAVGSPDAELEVAGGFGAGPHAQDSAYWINAHSMWFGCSDDGNTACEVTVNGYKDGLNEISVSQTFEQPPCLESEGCSLSLIHFESNFVGLSAIQISARVRGLPVDYYMDNLVLSWSNNSCDAQQERDSQ